MLLAAANGCATRGAPQGFSGVTCNDGHLYLASMDGRMMAINPEARATDTPYPSAEGEWAFQVKTTTNNILSCGKSSTPSVIYTPPAVHGDMVVLGTYDGKVMAFADEARAQDLPFPQIRSGEWGYPREEGETIGPLVGSPVIADGTVYVSSSDGRVYALDARFGDEIWVSEKLSEKLWAAPVISGSHVYVTTFDGRIHGLQADTGKLSPWTFEAESGFVSSPALYQEILVAGSAGRQLYAVRLGEQEALWKLEGGDWFWAKPLVNQGRVYASCLDGNLYAVDARTGESLWSRPFDAGERLATSPVLVNDSLVIATEPGNVFIVDAQTGKGRLLTGAGKDRDHTVEGRVLASLGGSTDSAYVLTEEDRVYAVDVRRETVSWEFSLDLE